MKFTLIQPQKSKDTNLAADQSWHITRPYSIIYLYQTIKSKTDFDVNIVDFEKLEFSNYSVEHVLKNSKSDIFGITATTYIRFEAIEIAKMIKKLHPDAIVVVGGVHFMYCAADTLHYVPEIDIVVRGEGEITIVDLLNAIDKKKSLGQVKGITYRQEGKVCENPDREVFEDLDSLPIYEDFTWEEYPEYLIGYSEKIKATSIISSRGCPYRCIFCAKAGMKYRLRNPSLVVDEIEFFLNKFQIEGINFLDLTFTADSRQVQQVCHEIISRNLTFQWWCESRANIPLELLDRMEKAGCASIALGVESGSPRIISAISKGISLDQVTNFCKKCNDLGIFITTYFMFSHPGETFEDAQNTLDFMDSLENIGDYVSCETQPTMIFPGTRLEKIALEKDILSERFSWSTPCEFELNVQLGQHPNIPLFIDSLSPYQLLILLRQREIERKIKLARKTKFADLISKTFKEVMTKRSRSVLFTRQFYSGLYQHYKRNC